MKVFLINRRSGESLELEVDEVKEDEDNYYLLGEEFHNFFGF
jgi:hypothetical protein